MVFNIGDLVVYPNQGIAHVDEIRVIEAGNGPARFYVLRLEEGGSVVMVPVDNAREVGLRPPIGGAECKRLLTLLAAPFEVPPTHWKDRRKAFFEKTRTGDIFTLADVLKKLTYMDLYGLAQAAPVRREAHTRARSISRHRRGCARRPEDGGRVRVGCGRRAREGTPPCRSHRRGVTLEG
jgi:CarD family transcriptional regulator